jgi:transposase
MGKSDSDASEGNSGGEPWRRDTRKILGCGIVEAGESAREAARLLNVGASTAIRWIERWTTTGSVDAKPGTGHSRSPLERHKQWLLDLIATEPDLTLKEIRVRLRSEKKQKAGIGSIWRFYDRHDITFKKNSKRRGAGSP